MQIHLGKTYKTQQGDIVIITDNIRSPYKPPYEVWRGVDITTNSSPREVVYDNAGKCNCNYPTGLDLVEEVSDYFYSSSEATEGTKFSVGDIVYDRLGRKVVVVYSDEAKKGFLEGYCLLGVAHNKDGTVAGQYWYTQFGKCEYGANGQYSLVKQPLPTIKEGRLYNDTEGRDILIIHINKALSYPYIGVYIQGNIQITTQYDLNGKGLNTADLSEFPTN